MQTDFNDINTYVYYQKQHMTHDILNRPVHTGCPNKMLNTFWQRIFVIF